MSPAKSASGRPHSLNDRADVGGLRAVAVLSVIAYHMLLLPGGFVGVDVFFVISGYLIGGIIFKELGDGSFNLIRFYERRVRRILPALVSEMSLWCPRKTCQTVLNNQPIQFDSNHYTAEGSVETIRRAGPFLF